MQRVQEEESHTGYTPPPPYTLVDQHNNNNNNNNINNNNNVNNNNNNPIQQQYHSQNPYPATVIPPDADFRLAQKLQDEEYAHWVDTNPQQEYYRSGETSISTHLPRAPMPPIPEHYQYNHYQSYQNEPNFPNTGQSQQYPVIYASPNQPPLPYQTSPYASNCAGNGQVCYGSMNQGYYHSSQSHPFYNAPYHNYQQISQREVEEDNSNCLSGLYDQFFIISVCVIIVLYILKYFFDFDFNFDT